MCKSFFLCIFAKRITLNINNKYLEYWIIKKVLTINNEDV